MAVLQDLQLRFWANVSEITSDLSKIEKQVDKFSKNVDRMGKAAAASLATIGAGAVFGKMVQGAKDAEAAMAQVNAAIKSTGGAAGVTAKQIAAMSTEIKRMTGIDDDLVNSMSSVLLTFTKVGKDVFPQATKAIIDMSTRLGTDLNSSAIQVGKALQDPIKGVTALSKAGVSFSESQKAVIKNLTETGQVAKAQAIILKELETEFGGSAAAARDTLGGALKALQQNIDDLLDSFEGSRGLRETVEFTNIVLEDMADYIKQLRDPASQASKQMDGFGAALTNVATTARVWANTIIYGVQIVWKSIADFGKNAGALFGGISKAMSPMSGALMAINPVAGATVQAFGNIGKQFQKNDQIIRSALQSGAMPDYFKYFDDAADRAQKKMAELHKEASKAKGPKGAGADVSEGLSKAEEKALKAAEKAAKAKEKLVENEKKSIEELIAGYRQKNVDLEASLDKHKEIADQIEIEHKISGKTNVSLKERLAAIAQIGQITRERVELERKIEAGKEKEKLQDVLKAIKDQNEELRIKNKKSEELLPILDAEKQIRDVVKVGQKETLELQEQIKKAAQEQSEIIKAQKHEEALKTLREMSGEYDKQVSALQAKLRGEDDLLPLLEQEKKIREDINLSDAEKEAAITNNRNKHEQIKQLNQALEAQKDLIDEIKGSSGSYAEKLAQLNQALATNEISSKQWNETAKDIWQTQKKAKTGADEFASTLVGGLSKAITSGKGFISTLKDMGKQLALFAAQRLLLQPLEKAIADLGNWMMGTGKYTPAPAMPASGIANAGGLGGLGGLIPAFGGPASAPGGGFFGGGLSSLLSSFSGGRNNRQWGGPENATDEILSNEYDRLYDSGKDALGGPLQDFEYYSRQLPRGEAARRLGIAGVDLTGPPKQGGIFGGLAKSLGIPGFALGGTAAAGQAALFGENGPELAIPKADLHVYTSGQTREILNGMSGGASERLFGGHALNVGGSAFSHSVGGGGSAGWIAGGGGNITPQQYLGDWVPQGRRDLLSSIGFSSAGSRVLALMKQIREEKNNYAKKALNDELTNALFYREKEWEGLIGEYRDLASAANYAGAQKVVNEETAAGRGEGLAAMANNAILSNNHISHGVIAQGRLVAPRGNAVEDAIQAGKLSGKTPSKALLQHLAALDAEASADYMPGNFIRPSTNYSSMGMGFAGQGGKVFGYDDAAGGDGRQAAIGDLLNDLRDSKWATEAASSYWKSMNNRNPLGSYQGASAEYLKNIKSWNNFPKNYFGPGANSSYGGPSDYPGEGFALTSEGYVPTGATGDTNGWIDGESTGSRNPQPFDPTVVSDAYSPKLFNSAGWRAYMNKNPYFDTAKRIMSGLQGAGRPSLSRGYQGSLMDMLGGVARSALAPLAGAANSWKPGRTAFGVPLPRELQNPFAGDTSMSLPAYPAAMGIATANPKIVAMSGPQPFRGNLSPYADDSYRTMFVNQHRDKYSTVGNSAFGRYQTDPFTAGRINARMRGFASGGLLRAGELAVVGERGKEFVMSPQDAQVVPATGSGSRPELKVIVNAAPGYTAQADYDASGNLVLTQLAKAVGSKLNDMNFPGSSVPRRRPIR